MTKTNRKRHRLTKRRGTRRHTMGGVHNHHTHMRQRPVKSHRRSSTVPVNSAAAPVATAVLQTATAVLRSVKKSSPAWVNEL